MPILERLNQLVNWKTITKGGEGRIVVWWLGETSTTDFALWCRQGASWAARRGQLRQVALTGLAEETRTAFCPAQQAVLGQEPRARPADQSGSLR